MKIQRDDFLQSLESVSPGLSDSGGIEQANCLIFKDGDVMTFNDEVSVRCPSGLGKDFSLAVPSKVILVNLRKWKEEEIDVEPQKDGLLIRGKGSRKAFFQADREISSPIACVEKPGKWKKLPEDFGEAVRIVSECAKDTGESLAVMCVSIHPKFIEASDNLQLTRYKVDTGVENFVLVRKTAIKQLPPLDMTEMSETKGWLHFRNPAGVTFSVRKNAPPEDYGPDYWSPFLKKEGEKITLPKNLAEAADKAADFLSEEANAIRVEIRDGKMRVKGEGSFGWLQEVKSVEYKGRDMGFLVSPKLLAEMVNKHHEALVTEGRLLVDSGKFVSALCLEKLS